MRKMKMTRSQEVTLSNVKKEMDLPRIAKSARIALLALANVPKGPSLPEK
jgi:hypothetical protein